MRALSRAALWSALATCGIPMLATAQVQHPEAELTAPAAQHGEHAMNQPVDADAQKTPPSEAPRADLSSTEHVAPPPPQHPMHTMSAGEMADVMEMDDAAPIAMLKLDRLEYADGGDAATAAWKVSASAGGDLDKVLFRSEGEHTRGESEHADAELLWNHAAAAFWDTQVGVRHDFGRGRGRTWAAFGVQGLAPYWFEVGATGYIGDGGRTALRIEIDYELSLTQRLILQPRVELNAYGREDASARVGSGLSDAALGLRLRYEIRREFAPYVGVERDRLFGRTADFARVDDSGVVDTRWVVGLRVWY